MTKCKSCNVDIPEGEQYCDNCIETNKAKASESYLDSLLMSVTNNSKISQNLKKKDAVEASNKDKLDKSISEQSTHFDTNTDEDFYNDDILAMLEELSEEETSNQDNNELTVEDDILALDNNELTAEDDIIALDNNELTVENDMLALDNDYETPNADDDLMALLDMITGSNEIDTYQEEEQPFALEEQPFALEEQPFELEEQRNDRKSAATKTDSIDSTSTIDDDILAITELMNNNPDLFGGDTNNLSNVGDIFSEAVSAVSSLDDDILEFQNQNDELAFQSDVNELNKKIKKKNFFQKLLKSDNNKENNSDNNVKEDNKTSLKKSKKKKQVKPSSEVQEKNVKVKKSKSKEKITENNDSAKEKPVKVKKVREKKVREKKNVNPIIESFEEETGKINKIGLVFIVAFCCFLATFIILGTKVYSYSLSLKKANIEFSRQRYTQAYNEIYGLNIKKEDMEIYEKIMTVMFVNKQLNSFNNYYALGQYPEALNSLLKGLLRYDKHMETAKALGIKQDLDNVKSDIIYELEDKFDIIEEEAMNIINSSDQIQYSNNILNAIKINNSTITK